MAAWNEGGATSGSTAGVGSASTDTAGGGSSSTAARFSGALA